ncbi:glycine cleavage system H lipoate-binding protein [Parabacteroides sp. PFB2-12]|uniref:hypothetical protein n=1 Tax=unclassified Parabacteroides TaxID=2649774 RepID=UPI0024730712|nr:MULTISPECIES: hypothetical protein [unclassified Parabacteroides]MDH6344040.1 glycine cleavage system H lipoate-binding protein [Parabacteroides sp. PM6-13]MDH6391900.1 glycine cleavage system H lipoate-binding protein [Parabacteroides sp. PFB2-12]
MHIFTIESNRNRLRRWAGLRIGEKWKEKGERRKEIGIEDRLAEGAEQIGKVGTDAIGLFLQIGEDVKILESPKGLQLG